MRMTLEGLSQLSGVVVRIVATELRTSEDRVRSARSLKGELGMDSIAAANVVFALEEECSTDIEIGEEDNFDTIEDIVAIVHRALGAL